MTSTERVARPVLIWLWTTAAMVAAMALIGAITRLTESGLSMVEWRPLIGAIPPVGPEEWQRVFELYKQTPEYQHRNFGMTQDAFQTIFFWEWLHRFWGRLIGLVYALPLLFFWWRGYLPQWLKPRFLLILLLGALQALMGWWMVKSGLIDRPSVSHYRLAAHLGLAFVIFSFLIWTAWDCAAIERRQASWCKRRHGWTALGTVALALIWGAFVAGLDAGLIYNRFPGMAPGSLLPALPEHLPVWQWIFSDPGMVQFAHRWLALFAAALTGLFAWRVRTIVPAWGGALMALCVLQPLLGIATLLSGLTISLATLHQAGALALIFVHLGTLRRLGS